jgi:transposase
MNNLEIGQQIKEILASNDKANRGRKPYKWSAASSSTLKELAAKPSVTCAKIAETINDKFGTTFTDAAVWWKARRLGITRRNRAEGEK